jgi:hypothetical protein
MKRFIIGLLIIVPVLTIAQDKKETQHGIKPKIETKMMVIKGDNDWLKTGFLLKSTDKVEVTASGEIRFSNGEEYSKTGPNGYSRNNYIQDFIAEDAAYCIDPLEDASHAALIGKAKGSEFLIGDSKTITGKSGPLYIGINDCSFKSKYYNTGQFSVNIKVIRGK